MISMEILEVKTAEHKPCVETKDELARESNKDGDWWTHSNIIQVAEKKIMDIEEELKIVGANMQVRQFPMY